MKSARPPRFTPLNLDQDRAAGAERAVRDMRDTLHAMGLYLDSLHASASTPQIPVISHLQESVLLLGELLNRLGRTSPIHTSALRISELQAAALRGMACLVISDNADVLRSIVEVLRTWGCQVQGATSAKDAQGTLASSNRYELVLVDLHRDETDSLSSLLEQIRLMQHGALSVVLGATSILSEADPESAITLPSPLAPAKLRALLLAWKLRSTPG